MTPDESRMTPDEIYDHQQIEVAHLRFHQLLDQPSLEIGCNPQALYDYIQDNWPESDIIELTRLLLDLEPHDMVE